MKDNQNISVNDAIKIAIHEHKINILDRIAWIDFETESKKGNKTFY